MLFSKKICFLNFILFIYHIKDIACENNAEWEDVAELGFKFGKNKEDRKSQGEESECKSNELKCNMLKKLLSKIPLNALVTDGDEEYIELKVKVAQGDFKRLKDFTLGDCGNSGQVNIIIHKAIRNIEVIPSNKIDWLILFYDFANRNQEILSLIIVSSTIFGVLVWWWTFSKSWKEVSIRGFILLVLFSSVWNWLRLYKNAIAEKEAHLAQAGGEIPIECRPQDMTFTQSLKAWYKGTFTFNEEECRKYYKSYLVDPFWDANPVTAVSDTLSRLLLQPMVVLAEFVGLALRELYSKLPVQFWIPVGIMLCIICFLFLIMVFNYRIRSFIFSLEPDSPPSNSTYLTNSPIQSVTQATPAMRLELVNNINLKPDALKSQNPSPLHLTGVSNDKVVTLSPTISGKLIKVTNSNNFKEDYEETIQADVDSINVQEAQLDGKKFDTIVEPQVTDIISSHKLICDQLIPPGSKITNIE